MREERVIFSETIPASALGTEQRVIRISGDVTNRELTLWERVKVRIFRRPDPRIRVVRGA